MQLQHLHLRTDKQPELERFYADTLGFPVTAAAGERSIRAGRSWLTFSTSDTPAYYHFAFNIPSLQIREAQEWLQQRVEILPDGDRQIIDFPNWNAQAVYFSDPAGNIVEFIGRQDLELPAEKPFSISNVEGISEIGLPSADVRAVFNRLHRQTGIAKYWGDYEHFCAAGNPQGLFIIVDEASKKWFPTDRPAKSFPLSVKFSEGETSYELAFADTQLLQLKKIH